MKFSVFIVFTVLSSIGSHPAQAGGDIVGNGGGLGEQNVLLAWQILPSLLEQCAALREDCLPVAGDLALLNRIKQTANHDYPADGALRFVSSSDQPGLFDLDPTGELAVVASAPVPGAPIYINLERLTETQEGQVTYVASLEDGVFLLSRTLGYVVSKGAVAIEDQLLRARVAEALKRLTSRQAIEVRASRLNQPQVLLLALNSVSQSSTLSSLLLADGFDQFNLTPKIQSKLPCEGKQTQSLQSLQGLFWYSEQVPHEDGRVSWFAQATLDWKCGDVTGRAVHFKTADLKIELEFKKSGNELHFIAGSDHYVLTQAREKY